MKTVEAILFDLGGVLVELKGVPAMLKWSALNLDEQSLWQRWLHSPGVRAFEYGQISADEFADRIIDELQLVIGRSQFLEAFIAWPSGLYEGVPALLRRLRPDYTLACLSNTSALHWSRLMDEMNLASHLDHHFASHLIGKIKPDVDCFEHVLTSLGLKPDQVLFFDDNRTNIEGAKAVGMRAVEVKGITGIIDYLKSEGLHANSA